MLPTPTTTHVPFSRIYEPAEDSYLLLDTFASPSESAFLTTRFPSSTPAPIILEVGTGSGVVLAFLLAHAKALLGRTDVAGLGTDLNIFACEATAQTAELARRENRDSAGAWLDAVQSDLTTALKPGCVDVLFFNPPYVPTESLPDAEFASGPGREGDFERDSHLLALSYAGGKDGMETTRRLLGQIPGVLSPRGVAYVLLCAQNRPEEVMAEIRTWPGDCSWQAEKVATSGMKAGWEKLCVVRIWRDETSAADAS